MSKATHSLPVAGGLWDQPAYVMQAFEEFESAEGEEHDRRIAAARQRAEAGSSETRTRKRR